MKQALVRAKTKERCDVMRKLMFAISVAIGLSGTSVGQAMAVPANGLTTLPVVNDVQQVQYFFGGRRYCWYDFGWRGPGWYWCGYSSRRGYGWGGGYGWHGWGGGHRIVRGRGGRGGHIVGPSGAGRAGIHSGRVGGRAAVSRGGHRGGGHGGGGHGGGGHRGGGHGAHR